MKQKLRKRFIILIQLAIDISECFGTLDICSYANFPFADRVVIEPAPIMYEEVYHLN